MCCATNVEPSIASTVCVKTINVFAKKDGEDHPVSFAGVECCEYNTLLIVLLSFSTADAIHFTIALFMSLPALCHHLGIVLNMYLGFSSLFRLS